MKCPKCQTQNPEKAKFCIECASPMEFHCPNCGAVTPATGKFCMECAHELRSPAKPAPIDYDQPHSYTPKHLADKILTSRSSIEGERKLVTVLFADVADYTAMSEKLDPEEVHTIMDGCFKILMDEIHKYEGTINQFTGDGVMALFGAPVAHEDHAQRACHAALAIQKKFLKYGDSVGETFGVPFKMRIGLNSGPVIVGSIGDDLRMDYTAVGDTTNLAARMESMAGPGTILASENTHRLAGDYFEFDSLGEKAVKGKASPQGVFKLIRAGEVDTRIEASVAKGLTRFVGRRNSMAMLREAFEKVRSGSGQIVGIVGEAGVGKSRLLLEMIKTLPQREYTYLEGQGLHYGGSMTYLPILDILRSYFEIEEGDRPALIKKKMEKKILDLDEKLKDTLPPFQELFSLAVEDEGFARLEPTHKKERTFEAVRDLIVRLSQERPLVLVFEDLHWIDKTTEEFLDYLIGWLANISILLLLLYRPEYTHPWGSKSYYTKIGLDQLGVTSSTELVRAILEEGEVAPELKELILNRAAGNPLFMEEFTHTLLENGSIQREDQRYILSRRPEDIQVPDTIQGIIAARMDRLEDNLKRTMQVASVIGRDFAFRILQTITGMKEELKSHLLNLQGLEFIYEKRLFPELEYIFKHALTQEVAYNSLLLKRRMDIHEKIGRAIEELYPDRLEEFYGMLAYHFARSERKDKAVAYLVLANKKAVRASAVIEAKALFDEAMKLLDELPDTETNQKYRLTLIVQQRVIFSLLSKMPEYYDLFERYEPVAARLGDIGLKGAFCLSRGVCEWIFGHFEQAVQSLTRAIELLEPGATVEVEDPYQALIWCYMSMSQYDKVMALKEKVLEGMKGPFNPRWYVWMRTGVAIAYVQMGDWQKAVEEGEEAMRVAEKASDRSLVSFAAWCLSFAYIARGDFTRALEYGELGVASAPTPADKAWSQTPHAWALCHTGQTEKGVSILTDLVQIFRAAGFFPGEINCIHFLADGYRIAGDNEKARKAYEECLKTDEEHGTPWYLGWAHLGLAEVLLEKKFAEAKTHLEESMAISSRINARNTLATAYASYGHLHKLKGDYAMAREYLTRALNVYEELRVIGWPDEVKKKLASLPIGHEAPLPK